MFHKRLQSATPMSSMLDQEASFDRHDIGKQVLAHMKTYCFFVYYQKSHLPHSSKPPNLQKLSFKLRDDKNHYTERYGDNNKNVQLCFIDLEDEMEMSQSLHDLKATAQQMKTKLIFISSESTLVGFYVRARTLGIDVSSLPICIYTAGVHSDLSRFLGWGEPGMGSLAELSVGHIEKHVRKWVESPAEKIDIWAVEIKVSEEGGSIEKLNQNNGDLDKFKSNAHKELFISNLSIGYHPNLLLNYEQKKSREPSFINRLIYSFQGMKKFCCVGESDLRETTGLVKIDFVDDKGEHEILKYLRESEGDEEEQLSQHRKSPMNKKRVLSVVLSNIDRFFGEKINNNSGSKMNDQKLQLITYQSKGQSTSISSVTGHINIQFSPENPVYLHVNDSCFRLEKPLALSITPYGKARAIINKQTLCC